MSKKIGLGLLGLLVLAVIYYFTVGKTQLTNKMKLQVNNEVQILEKNGFSVTERKLEEKKESFILAINEPKKIETFFKTQGIQTNIKDLELLQGLKIGVDLAYLADMNSAISFDFYPLTLPTLLTQVLKEKKKEKTLKYLNNMLQNKTILMHVSINKSTSSFNGYLKDIDETIQEENNTHITIEKLTFSGDINSKKIESFKQSIKNISFSIDNTIEASLINMTSHYMNTGKTKYDYKSGYGIDTLRIKETNKPQIHLQKLSLNTDSIVNNNLASVKVLAHSKNIEMVTNNKPLYLKNLTTNFAIENLDIVAFEKIENMDTSKQKDFNNILQTLLSKGIQIDVPEISVANIISNGETIKGFDFNAKLEIDKSFDVQKAMSNPLKAFASIDASLYLGLSKELFTIISKQPQAMLAIMLFQPQDINGTKVYDIKLKDSHTKINGKPFNFLP